MAYDRYVAVVKPLHYTTIINTKVCITMIVTVWVLGFLVPLSPLILITPLPFCTTNYVNHLFCDYVPVLALSCEDVTAQENLALFLAIVSLYVPCLFVLWSYCKIILSVIRLKSVEGRKKAFSMCSSHMVVVVIYYVSSAMEYIALRVESISPEGRIFIGSLNFFFTPLINPIIYSLRNEHIKSAAQRYLSFKTIF
ncbi:olfactory receptor 6C4-like [Lepisosteus oculatus]